MRFEQHVQRIPDETQGAGDALRDVDQNPPVTRVEPCDNGSFFRVRDVHTFRDPVEFGECSNRVLQVLEDMRDECGSEVVHRVGAQSLDVAVHAVPVREDVDTHVADRVTSFRAADHEERFSDRLGDDSGKGIHAFPFSDRRLPVRNLVAGEKRCDTPEEVHG